ncbi:MAG: hypothetical protein QOJ62_1021 [Actinomycetota bacterium]|jgi:hypothetical protein|nr:hypothetical protein [Actinomycetota bacterium]
MIAECAEDEHESSDSAADTVGSTRIGSLAEDVREPACAMLWE